MSKWKVGLIASGINMEEVLGDTVLKIKINFSQMDTNKEKIFEVAKNMFYRNGKRKEVIEFIKSKGILGEDADQLATVAYKSVKGKIHQAIEVRAHKSHGGPIGKIAIGLFAIGIGIFSLFVLDLTFYFIFLFGFGFLVTGIIGLFVNPAKTKVD